MVLDHLVLNCTVSGKLDVLSTEMVIAIKVGAEEAVSFDFLRNITGNDKETPGGGNH